MRHVAGIATAAAAIVAIAVLASLDQGQAAAYSAVVYPALTRWLVPVVDAVTWSWTAAFAGLGVIVLLVVAVRRPRRGATALALALLVAGATGLAGWGVHYRRAPLAERRALAPVAAAEVNELIRALSEQVRVDAPDAPLGDSDVAAAVVAIQTSLVAVRAQLEGEYVRVPARVKLLPPGTLLTFGAAGVISPWFLEAHVDAGLPPAARIAVAAHELAHVAGYAREDEAEAVGALAGWRSSDPSARYAAALFQVARWIGNLPESDREEAWSRLPDRARADVSSAAEAAATYRNGVAAGWAWRVYDRWLRSQGVPDGVESYGGGIELLARLTAAGVASNAGIPATAPPGNVRSASP